LSFLPIPNVNCLKSFRSFSSVIWLRRTEGPLEGKEVSEKGFSRWCNLFSGTALLERCSHRQALRTRSGKHFEIRARELAAVPVTAWRQSHAISPFPLIPVTYVLWKEDEEFLLQFPSSSTSHISMVRAGHDIHACLGTDREDCGRSNRSRVGASGAPHLRATSRLSRTNTQIRIPVLWR